MNGLSDILFIIVGMDAELDLTEKCFFSHSCVTPLWRILNAVVSLLLAFLRCSYVISLQYLRRSCVTQPGVFQAQLCHIPCLPLPCKVISEINPWDFYKEKERNNKRMKTSVTSKTSSLMNFNYHRNSGKNFNVIRLVFNKNFIEM